MHFCLFWGCLLAAAVTFPLVFPGILGAALLSFSLSFDDFIVTFVDGSNEYIRFHDKGKVDLESFEQIVIEELEPEQEI